MMSFINRFESKVEPNAPAPPMRASKGIDSLYRLVGTQEISVT